LRRTIKFPFNFFQATAQYCELLNKFFDLYNSKIDDLDSCASFPPEKQPFGHNIEEQMKILDEIYEFVDKMRKKGDVQIFNIIVHSSFMFLNFRGKKRS
jgi:hypothetical protein